MNQTIQLKKGKYFIGDPQYVFGKNWFEASNDLRRNDGHKCFGKDCLYGCTYMGDGLYLDNEKREYGVDSGCLGIFHFKIPNQDPDQIKKCLDMKILHAVIFKEDFTASHNERGIFDFGHLHIDTENDSDIDDDDQY